MNKYQEYWVKRNEQLFLNGEKSALDSVINMKKYYDEAIRQINLQINAFYGKYARENKIDINESKKLLDKSELKDFNSSLDDIFKYVKEHKLDKDYENKLKLLRAKSRVSRMEELKTNIEFEIQKLSNNVENDVKDILSDTYEEGYYKTIFNNQKFFGFGKSFTSLNTLAITKAITTPYMAENYSDVIWKNKNSLLNILNQQIPQGMILGYNPKKVAQIASKKLETNYKSTVRLVRTEYNLILNDASFKGYQQCGIDEYELLATLDNRTSEICQEMDGKHFKLSEKEVGVNYPPLHPNCRTTTIPYFPIDEIDKEYGIGTRIAKDKNGKYYKVPANTTYEEWKNNLKTNIKGNSTFSSDKVIKKATSDVNEWKNSLSKPELDALQNYSWKELDNNEVADYKDINNYLRFGEVSSVGKTKIQNAIDYIDSAIDKFKLDKDITVYRGTNTASLIEQLIGEKKFTRNLDVLNSYLKGKTLENKSFISTSLSQKEALNFGLGNGLAIMKINIPAGTKGAYIDNVSRISREKEFLLGRDTKFKIKNIRMDNRLERWVINCELV